MSDLEWLKLFADGLSGDDPGHEEVHWAAAEIERLREIAKDKLHWESVAAKAMKRIEELERPRDPDDPIGTEHYITDAQIDAAVGYVQMADHGPEHCHVCGWNTLATLGIVRDGDGWKIGGPDE